MTNRVKHPWEVEGKFYVYNEFDRIIGGPQRVISEVDRNRLICPHCPYGLRCLTNPMVGKDLQITESIPPGPLLSVRCEIRAEPWRSEDVVIQFHIPISVFGELP